MTALEAALIIALGFLVTNLVICAFVYGAGEQNKRQENSND